MSQGYATPTGGAMFEILRKRAWVPEPLDARLRAYQPRTHFGELVRACFTYLPRWLAEELLDELRIILVGESQLEVCVIRASGALENYGVVSRKVVTDTGVGFIVDAFQNLVELENMKFHGLGTGTNAEAVGNTALQTELTTQYNPDNTRATGTTTEASANQYVTVGTNTLDASATIQEHGVFSQAATGGGVLLDRSLTGGQALSSGDGLTATYTFTLTSGG